MMSHVPVQFPNGIFRGGAAAVSGFMQPARVFSAKAGFASPAVERQGLRPVLRICHGFRDLVGSTPLIRLRSASQETGCSIWGKCEFLNPGGSVKDRPAVYMLNRAEQQGELTPGAWVVEASAGNTAIALSLAAREHQYRLICVIPETQTEEKKSMLRTLGALVLPVPFQKVSHPNHYTRVAARLARNIGGFYCGQFDNTANRQSHFETTGPEIWSQTGGNVDGFICAVGTGGTLAGVAASLRQLRQQRNSAPALENIGHMTGSTPKALACTDSPVGGLCASSSSGTSAPGESKGQLEAKVRTDQVALRSRLARILAAGGPCIGLVDIRGAGLFRLYTAGTLRAEGSSIVENIGQNRVTGNLEGFAPDFACEVTDEEALTWTFRLLQEEGLALGMTSGVNVAGAVRLARAMGPGHQIVTVLCDYGHLYSSKQWNPAFLRTLSLPEPRWIEADVDPEVAAALKASFVSTVEINAAS